ncbi:type II toxin-antitoxin system VapC family toxin [Myxococcota bacterium]
MNRPLAVLDTSALILLLTSKQDDSPEEQDAERRREAVREAIRSMQARHRFAIPSVVIAELGRGGSPESDLEQLVGTIGRFRVLPLTLKAAIAAARIAQVALARRQRGLGSERGAVKFDVLICATAHAHGAGCIITENPRDFAKHLESVGSAIEVRVPSEPPERGQIHLLQRKPKC